MKRGVGGTDVGPVVALYRPELAPDLAKYVTAADVWMRQLFDIEQPKSGPMVRGIAAEPRLRRAYVDAYGGELEEHERPWVVPHPRHKWATCSPDDVARDNSPIGTGDADPMTIECERTLIDYKSTVVFARHKWGEPETDEVPPVYSLQMQWNMEILNLDVAHLFVGFGRDVKDASGEPRFLYDETVRFVLYRDAEIASMCLDLCHRFKVEHLDSRKPPPVQPAHNRRAFSRLLKEQPWTTEAQPSQS